MKQNKRLMMPALLAAVVLAAAALAACRWQTVVVRQVMSTGGIATATVITNGAGCKF